MIGLAAKPMKPKRRMKGVETEKSFYFYCTPLHESGKALKLLNEIRVIDDITHHHII